MRSERISGLARIWPEIFDGSGRKSPFLSYEWFTAISGPIIKNDPEAFVFFKKDRPVGILPASVEGDCLRLIGDVRVTDINGLLFLPGCDDLIINELVSLIQKRGLKVDLSPVEENDPLVEILPGMLPDIKIENGDRCPLLILPDSWEVYLESLDGKDRHELRRKLKKASRVEYKDLGPEAIDTLFELMSASDKEKALFLDRDVQSFFSTLAQTFHNNGWLRFRGIVLDFRPIGIIFSFQTDDRIYVYNMGFDPEFQHLSPGFVTIALDIRTGIEEGFKYYDFLRGDEAYKLHFGAKIRHTMRIRR